MSDFVKLNDQWWLNFDEVVSIRLRTALTGDARRYGYRDLGSRWYELTFREKPRLYAADSEEPEEAQYRLTIDENEEGEEFDAITAWLNRKGEPG